MSTQQIATIRNPQLLPYININTYINVVVGEIHPDIIKNKDYYDKLYDYIYSHIRDWLYKRLYAGESNIFCTYAINFILPNILPYLANLDKTKIAKSISPVCVYDIDPKNKMLNIMIDANIIKIQDVAFSKKMIVNLYEIFIQHYKRKSYEHFYSYIFQIYDFYRCLNNYHIVNKNFAEITNKLCSGLPLHLFCSDKKQQFIALNHNLFSCSVKRYFPNLQYYSFYIDESIFGSFGLYFRENLVFSRNMIYYKYAIPINDAIYLLLEDSTMEKYDYFAKIIHKQFSYFSSYKFTYIIFTRGNQYLKFTENLIYTEKRELNLYNYNNNTFGESCTYNIYIYSNKYNNLNTYMRDIFENWQNEFIIGKNIESYKNNVNYEMINNNFYTVLLNTEPIYERKTEMEHFNKTNLDTTNLKKSDNNFNLKKSDTDSNLKTPNNSIINSSNFISTQSNNSLLDLLYQSDELEKNKTKILNSANLTHSNNINNVITGNLIDL